MRLYLAALLVMAVPGLCLGVPPVAAQEPSAVGLWQQVDDSTGKIQGWFIISEHGSEYVGTIVKMFMEPGEDPNPHCEKCPGDQKGAPWLGLTIIHGMERKGLDYENGMILDPRDGSEYHALMHLDPNGQALTVRGYLGFSLLGRNQYWKRLPDSAFAQLDPALVNRLLPGAIPPAAAARPNPAPKSRGQATPAPPQTH
jgi:uncharacterized protein (DUF2147 family)